VKLKKLNMQDHPRLSCDIASTMSNGKNDKDKEIEEEEMDDYNVGNSKMITSEPQHMVISSDEDTTEADRSNSLQTLCKETLAGICQNGDADDGLSESLNCDMCGYESNSVAHLHKHVKKEHSSTLLSSEERSASEPPSLIIPI